MRGKLRSKGRAVHGVQAGPVKRILGAEELTTLIKWLPNFSNTVADVLTLYLWTCARGSEIMAMEVSEISEDDDGLWSTIPKAKMKNSWREHATDLRVPLIGRAEVVVRRRMDAAKGAYLFASRGKVPYMEQKSVGVAVWFHMPYSKTKPEDLRPRLPVTNWAPHDLRRSCRTQLAILGCTEEVAEAVLGHMKKGVVGVYNRHAYDQERREYLGWLNTHLEAL
ncbi:tyrosine-type recombinase/integrase [Janthinobacterium sp. J1-1]|uniref:tyrosine-type recombinase/integrase n=1 Tax=Janthinobacterium sp. J1-1 TaxID=3065910 RepID=UPI0035AF0CCD